MRKIVLTVFVYLITLGAFAQSSEVFTTVEKMPEFPGGQTGLQEYLLKNIKYPEEARNNVVEGVSYINFVVSSTGEVTGARVLKGNNEQFNQEALRVINAMPLWQPGMQAGQTVSVQYTLPVRFSLTVPEKEGKKVKK
ncbi:MAG TPA: energy transducer TonB [Bacteroidia bacterium]|jgi:TonB family protein|nr:energy transducer TonB [Bacteroidia bacterium]HMU19161.1 energy transducer TonB [Bacteroidia bacterium]